MKTIPITDEMLAGAVSIEHFEDSIQAWRIPHLRREYYYPLIGLGACGAGVRLQLTTDTQYLRLDFVATDQERTLDLCIGNQLHQSLRIDPDTDHADFDLSAHSGTKNISIWLPQSKPMQLSQLHIDASAYAHASAEKRLKWLTYGSSITQCGEAHSPARTWPAIVARKLDLDLCCLGFSGNCMLETSVAHMLSQQTADIITLKLGINVYGVGHLSLRTYQPAVIGLIELIRTKHPDTPIGVITSIYSSSREENLNPHGMNLKDFRHETAEAVRRIQLYADERIDVYDGLELFGADLADYLPDGLHPNGDGYEILGNNIADHVLGLMLKKYALR